MDAADVGVREVAARLAGGDGQRAVAGRQLEVGALGPDRRAVGADDLHVPARLAERRAGDPQEEPPGCASTACIGTRPITSTRPPSASSTSERSSLRTTA